MATVVFTQNLRRHIAIERCTVGGATVNEALNHVFDLHPRVRGYILDDTGAVRTHVAILLNGLSINDRKRLTDAITQDSELFVMQALSGG